MTSDELDRIYDDLEVQEERARAQYRTRLALHPHCSDPAHPGCAECQMRFKRINASSNARLMKALMDNDMTKPAQKPAQKQIAADPFDDESIPF